MANLPVACVLVIFVTVCCLPVRSKTTNGLQISLPIPSETDNSVKNKTDAPNVILKSDESSSASEPMSSNKSDKFATKGVRDELEHLDKANRRLAQRLNRIPDAIKKALQNSYTKKEHKRVSRQVQDRPRLRSLSSSRTRILDVEKRNDVYPQRQSTSKFQALSLASRVSLTSAEKIARQSRPAGQSAKDSRKAARKQQREEKRLIREQQKLAAKQDLTTSAPTTDATTSTTTSSPS